MSATSRPTMPERVNVLLIGGGGREHALAWRLSQSPKLGRLWVDAAANAALRSIGTPCPEPIEKKALFRLNRWCDKEEIGLVVIGPEVPLAEGWADELASETRVVFGPGRAAARLEADKSWAKDIMRASSIPSAASLPQPDLGSRGSRHPGGTNPCFASSILCFDLSIQCFDLPIPWFRPPGTPQSHSGIPATGLAVGWGGVVPWAMRGSGPG